MSFFESRYWNLLWELTRTDFKLRDQGTLLGFIWTLLHPALMFIVLYVLFIKWIGSFVDNYMAFLIIGLVQWQFFEKATNAALMSLRNKSLLIRTFKFPREIIVFSAVGGILWSYLLELVVLFLFLMAIGISPGPGWFLIPAAVVVHLIFTLGISMVLALVALEYEDLSRIWSIVAQAGFYLTPIFYPLHIIAESRQKYMTLNPMLHLIEMFRSLLVGGSPPSWAIIVAILAVGIALIGATMIIFHRNDKWIADCVLEQ